MGTSEPTQQGQGDAVLFCIERHCERTKKPDKEWTLDEFTYRQVRLGQVPSMMAPGGFCPNHSSKPRPAGWAF